MHTLRSVLKFIELNEMSLDEFETETKLLPGAIHHAYDAAMEMNNEDINKVIDRYGEELNNLGFIIFSLEGWPGIHNDYAIIENDLNLLFFGDKN